MRLPEELRAKLEAELGPLDEARSVGGGCISSASRIVARGRSYFLKYEREAPSGFFLAEANGLESLRSAARSVRVPAVVSRGEHLRGWSWIVLEWLEPSAHSSAASATLGKGLAEIHRTRGEWGWDGGGFIGRLPQSNRHHSHWAEFWSRERLEPQREIAGHQVGTEIEWSRLTRALPEVLAPAESDGPSLLHGDLWRGNVVQTMIGPALLDPACYFGHREVDLAMTELFGGFDHRFYGSYDAEWPLQPGYELRREVYQLYYLLVHVNLFGGSYVSRTVDTLRRLLARIG